MTGKTFDKKEDIEKSLDNLLTDVDIKVTSFELSFCKDTPPQELPKFEIKEYKDAVAYMFAREGLKLTIKGEKGKSNFELIYKKCKIATGQLYGTDAEIEAYLESRVFKT